MESHCLKHQERVATKRCVSCLKPLCDECTQLYTGGIYCSDSCHQSALETQERAAQIAQSDRELKEWRQRRAAYRMIAMVALAVGIFLAWDHLPATLTGPIENIWDTVMGVVKNNGKG